MTANALKFSDPASPAPVEVTVRDGAVDVADRGPGLDPADLPRFQLVASRAELVITGREGLFWDLWARAAAGLADNTCLHF